MNLFVEMRDQREMGKDKDECRQRENRTEDKGTRRDVRKETESKSRLCPGFNK